MKNYVEEHSTHSKTSVVLPSSSGAWGGGSLLILLIMVQAIFAQEGIKFQIPTDASGAPVPVNFPAKPDTIQKLGQASGLPLNLAALSAKDTASFETYSKRYALVQDSISATYRRIESVRVTSKSFMPKFEPKGEFEKQAEFEARQHKWNTELAQRIERDTKSHTQRLAELEKAKNKIQENQASLYGSLEIKSNPSAVSLYIGKEEIGTTPAEYSLLIPGDAKIILRKEGYNQWDTIIKVNPGEKFKFNVALEEKSIFNQENEINLAKLLSKDSTIQGYLSRIEIITARKAQVAEEIKQILADFSNKYPPLEPQKADETPDAFKRRHEAWTREGMRQYSELQKKFQSYNEKLDRSVQVLNDYIAGEQSSILSEIALAAKIELGAYDAEKETFEITAQDTANAKSPFIFKGKVGVPLNTAKTLDRNAPGLATGVQFINYPFTNVNLAMSKLQLSKDGQDLKTEGSFGEIGRYKSMEGYKAWKLRADSLLNGSLKMQGLDYAYAMGKAASKDAAKTEKAESSGDGLGWRGWARIATFTAAAALGGVAVFKHLESERRADDINEFITKGDVDGYNAKADGIKDSEKQRNIYGAAAGGCALVGIITFIF